MKKSNEKFVRELLIKNPNIISMEEYINSQKKIKFKCNKCEYIWYASPNNILRGRGCPKCSKHKRRTPKEFLEELKQINPNITLLEEFKNSNTKILCKCNLCNHQWQTLPHNLLHGIGCPNCNNNSTSFTEQFIYLVLKDYFKDTMNRDRNTIGKELDIFIPSKNFAIEMCGWTWHKDIIEKDILKKELCKQKNIRLLSIYDSIPTKEQKKVKMIPDCLCFNTDLGSEKGKKQLKKLIVYICNQLGISSNISEDEWKTFETQAYIDSRRRTTEDYKNELIDINSDIEITSEYKGQDQLIGCVCKKCNYKWETRARLLLKGVGCPRCGGTLKKTHDEFIKQLNNINRDIEVLDEYKNNKYKLLCRCKNCNYEWKVKPYGLLRGNGCPKCAGLLKKTHEQFVEDLEIINPSIVPLEKYINASTKITCKCKECGYKWNVTPNGLLRGNGCPRCAGHIKKTTKDFIKELKQINPNIIPLENYINARTKILCKCKKCGYEWKVKPDGLLRSKGCPKCSGCLKKTHEQFVKELSEINPNIIVLGQYINSSTKILCKCKKCDNNWESTPNNLLRGKSCPYCWNIRLKNHFRD